MATRSSGRAPGDDERAFDDDNLEGNRPLIDDELPPKETRGEKKRKAEQLERLGVELVKLSPAKLARLPLPDDLRDAVVECQRITAHGGKRRQVQFIGRIMRGLDAVPIAAALEALRQENAPSSVAFRAAERWRDRLVAEGDIALEALVKELTSSVDIDRVDVDRTSLRQLTRQAQRERDHNKPPAAARALFRALFPLFTTDAHERE